MRFEPGELALLAQTEEIEIETAPEDGSAHRAIIWVVVDADEAFIRSYRGPQARWYQEAIANPAVTLHVAGQAIPATVEVATDPTSIQRTSDGLARKYPDDPATPRMIQRYLDTTLRLTPS